METRASQGIPERYGLVQHLRRHGKATAAHVWCSTCRWCRLRSWADTVREPASRDALVILQRLCADRRKLGT